MEARQSEGKEGKTEVGKKREKFNNSEWKRKKRGEKGIMRDGKER